MKKQILFSLIFLLPLGLWAQEGESDTTKISYKGKVITIYKDSTIIDVDGNKKSKKAKEVNHWRGLEFGTTGYFNSKNFDINNDPQNTYLELDYAKSFVLNVNFAEYNVNILKNKLFLMTGLGFRFNRYGFKSTKAVLTFNDTTIFNAPDTLRSFDKNFLNVSYISAPLYLKIMPGKDPEKSFHLSVGAVLNYRIGSRIKQKYSLNDQNFKDISRGHYHLSPFLLDASVRFGVGSFTAFANYGLTGLFEKNKGPQYYPFSAGLSLSF